MPCIKCNNNKWKYGVHGRCQFDTLGACKAAEAAIHAQENKPKKAVKPAPKKESETND
jgi:hypothetical protein